MANPTDATRRALLLIDFQKDFLASTGRMPVDAEQVEPAIAAANKAVDAARANGELIVKIGNEFRPSDVIGNLLRRHAAVKGSDGAAWDERINPPEAIYLPKWKPNAFCNPNLSSVLAEHQINEVLLTGLFAKACMSATAKGARKRGLSVLVIGDATACTSEESKAKALDRLRRSGIGVA